MSLFKRNLLKIGFAAVLVAVTTTVLAPAAALAATPAESPATTTPATTIPATVDPVAAKIIEHARTHMGDPYVFGKEGPDAWDCSSFVQHVYGEFGYDLPRVSKNQARVGVAVKESDLLPGDLLFYEDTWTKGVSHVGIYIGDGKILHAWPKDGVKISSIDSKYLRSHYWGARRVIGVMDRTAN